MILLAKKILKFKNWLPVNFYKKLQGEKMSLFSAVSDNAIQNTTQVIKDGATSLGKTLDNKITTISNDLKVSIKEIPHELIGFCKLLKESTIDDQKRAGKITTLVLSLYFPPQKKSLIKKWMPGENIEEAWSDSIAQNILIGMTKHNKDGVYFHTEQNQKNVAYKIYEFLNSNYNNLDLKKHKDKSIEISKSNTFKDGISLSIQRCIYESKSIEPQLDEFDKLSIELLKSKEEIVAIKNDLNICRVHLINEENKYK